MIIASEKNHYKKGDDIREIIVEIMLPVFKNDAWECQLIMKGNGEIDRTMFGYSSMQALCASLQHAKFNLTLMVNEGYNYFDKKENRELGNTDTLELLDAVFGHGTLLDEEHTQAIHLQVIRRLQNAGGSEEEQDADMNYLRKEFADPKIIDYIFNSKPEMSALEIYKKAKAYQPVTL
jgi:endo-alpha-1,4-polygalactosaminidase (GH114 family)